MKGEPIVSSPPLVSDVGEKRKTCVLKERRSNLSDQKGGENFTS